MRYFFSIFLYTFLFVSSPLAGAPEDVRELLQVNVDAVVVLLQNQSIDKEQRNEQIIEIITPIFDYQTMAKLSLGKKYWPTLSPGKRVAFSDLFIERLQESYLEKLDLYSDEKILYGDPLAKGKQIHQPTTLIAKDSRIKMLYKFYLSATGWKIYDVEIGGVSVIQTYRSQFDGVLRDGSIDDLLAKLRTDDAFAGPGDKKTEERTGSE